MCTVFKSAIIKTLFSTLSLGSDVNFYVFILDWFISSFSSLISIKTKLTKFQIYSVIDAPVILFKVKESCESIMEYPLRQAA